MNEITHKALMVEVERAVRPVRASHVRKLRMREELLAHLTAIFEEEIARSGDEETAMQQARIRFGDPRELAGELQQAVPKRDRLRFLLDQVVFQSSDSLLRLTVKYLLGTAVIFALSVVILLLSLWVRGRDPIFGTRIYVVGVMSAIIMGFMMLGILFIERLRKTFFADESRHSGVRAVIDILLCICAFPLLAFINYAALTGDLSASLTYFFTGCFFAPVAPVIFILMARQYDREMRVQEKWTSLEVDA